MHPGPEMGQESSQGSKKVARGVQKEPKGFQKVTKSYEKTSKRLPQGIQMQLASALEIL